MTSPETIKEKLHHSLANLEKYEKCALLDYPDYLNLGDHLIWLGSVLYLTEVHHTKIGYAASVKNFSAREMEEKIGKAPIFLNGGGNLGDLWGECQKFRETIITQYQDRPIVILPQSIYFKNLENLKKTANIFNSHPDLTIFVRDSLSYQLATEYFIKCQIILAPDMAFQMVNNLNKEQQQNNSNSILYLCRDDRELNQAFAPSQLELFDLVIEDWVSYQWFLGVEKTKFMRLVATLFREGWQRGLATPQEWFARQKWLASHLYTPKFQNLEYSSLHSRSWHFIYSAIYQLQPHKLVITNRLHGHILCILLKKPHIFLPNAYHKNELFYQTWTSEISFCKFVKDLEKIPASVSELLN